MHFGSLLAATLLLCSPIAPAQLPNDCALVATEAAARLVKTGVWVQVMHVTFLEGPSGPAGHAICVWQLPTSNKIEMYDQYFVAPHGASTELDTESHDATEIGKAIGKRFSVVIFEAHFL